MARILYGVAGEGMGHCMRAKSIIDPLSRRHAVRVVSSDNSFIFLSKFYKGVVEVSKPSIIYRQAKVNIPLTILKNIWDLRKAIGSLLAVRRAILSFRPDVVITDFEPFTGLMSKVYGIPLISVDNPSVLTQCSIDVPWRYWWSFLAARLISSAITNFPRYYIITTFFDAKPKHNNVLLFPPIVRKEVLNARRSRGSHVIVYQTSHNYDHLIPILNKIKGQRFIIYGSKERMKSGNVEARPLAVKEFIRDLASCRAVITNGGFTLISEALALGKPIMSVPVAGQFEQELNAMQLERLGAGKFARTFTAAGMRDFLSRLGSYEKRIASMRSVGNSAVVRKINELIARVRKD